MSVQPGQSSGPGGLAVRPVLPVLMTSRAAPRPPYGGRVEPRWTNPDEVLARAAELVGAPLPYLLERTSQTLRGLVPHAVAAQLTEVCAYAPKRAVGEEWAARVTGAELGRLSVDVRVGQPWWGEATLAGETRSALGIASAPRGAGGALLVLIDTGQEPPAEGTLRLVQRIWDLVTAHTYQLTAEAYPERTAVSRAAATARAAAIDEAADAYSAALAGILGTLRSTGLDDRAARSAATDLAVDALVGLRAMPYWNRELSEETAPEAFDRLVRELRPMFRRGPVQLSLRPPGTSVSLPSDTAHAARAVVRAAALALREQDGITRLHVGWWIEEDTLRATVRDDGPGHPDPRTAVTRHLTDRVAALGGHLTTESVPDWGTTLTVTLPLAQPAPPATGTSLEELRPRELQVLEHLARGRRNREIGAALHISESTVRFHVSNLLRKLGVSTRGEAVALALTTTQPQPQPQR